jgi:hypothetical protein
VSFASAPQRIRASACGQWRTQTQRGKSWAWLEIDGRRSVHGLAGTGYGVGRGWTVPRCTWSVFRSRPRAGLSFGPKPNRGGQEQWAGPVNNQLKIF